MRHKPTSLAIADPARRLSSAEDLHIERVGHAGDGVAIGADGSPLFVPWTLPGEIVRCGADRDPHEVLVPSPDRVSPPCPHFGVCGGCRLQHWTDAAYARWKAGLVAAALQRAGFGVAPLTLHRTPPYARRRMDFALRRGRQGVAVGLHAPGSADIADLATCHVLDPALFALVAPLRNLLRGLTAFRREGSLVANLLDSGPDLLLRLDAPVGAADRALLTGFARQHGIARIATALAAGPAELACQLRPVSHVFAGTVVTPPPGGFLQASREGEAAILQAVLAGLPESLGRKSWVADLFAGCGTLSFPLCTSARVKAFEGDAEAASALHRAAAAAGLGARLAVAQRDLARRPLLGAEWAHCAAAVLDPPRAGAAAQVAQIVHARLTRVIYISCHPATLARDAGLLKAAGYRLLAAAAIDQFLWSAQVESVSVFAA